MNLKTFRVYDQEEHAMYYRGCWLSNTGKVVHPEVGEISRPVIEWVVPDVTDCNGDYIFEGDIIDATLRNTGEELKDLVVAYDSGAWVGRKDGKAWLLQDLDRIVAMWDIHKEQQQMEEME